MILSEDLFDDVEIIVPSIVSEIPEVETKLDGPTPGVDTGIANELLSLINAVNESIQRYNGFKADIVGHEDFAEVIDSIITDEMTHIGMLQALLQKISPNTAAINDGIVSVEYDLNESLNEAKLQDWTYTEDEIFEVAYELMNMGYLEGWEAADIKSALNGADHEQIGDAPYLFTMEYDDDDDYEDDITEDFERAKKATYESDEDDLVEEIIAMTAQERLNRYGNKDFNLFHAKPDISDDYTDIDDEDENWFSKHGG